MSLKWKNPRTKLKLDDIRAVAEEAIERIEKRGAKPAARASECLLVARCVHALGAPTAKTSEWMHRAVDHAKKTKHLDADFVGAARLIGRASELARSIAESADDKSVEFAYAAALRAYAKDEQVKAPAVLKRRPFFFAYAAAAAAAQKGDLAGVRAALNRAPWQYRKEWTGDDKRKRPADLSWFAMAIAVDVATLDVIPRAARTFVDPDLVAAASAGKL